MYKAIYTYLILVMTLSQLSAQTLTRKVTASSGDTYQAAGVMLDWTLGETHVTRLNAPISLQLTQGFQQGEPTCGKDSYEPNDELIAASQIQLSNLGFSTFHNSRICQSGDQDWFVFETTPALPRVQIRLDQLPANYELELYNAQGGMIASSLNTDRDAEVISFGYIAPGSYYLRIYGNGGAYSAASAYRLQLWVRTPELGIIQVKNPAQINQASQYTLRELAPEMQCQPNPFKEQMSVHYELATEEVIQIRFTDALGRLISEILPKQQQAAGKYQLNLDAQNLPQGLYYCIMETRGQILTQKVLRLP